MIFNKQMTKQCACGCGRPVTKPKNKFLKGHNCRGKFGNLSNKISGKPRPKFPPQLCQCGCGRMTNKNAKFIHGHNCRNTPEEKLAKMHLCECGCGTLIIKRFRFVRGHNSIGKKRPEMSIRFSGKNNPMYDKHPTEEQRQRHSKIIIQHWKDPKYREKQILAKLKRSIDIKPNKQEGIVLRLLEQMAPGEWEYTGNFSFWINGKNPDFVNKNRDKIIEFFGDHWHKGENPQKRKEAFKAFGYETLIIWGHELKRINKVKFRIRMFLKRAIDF